MGLVLRRRRHTPDNVLENRLLVRLAVRRLAHKNDLTGEQINALYAMIDDDDAADFAAVQASKNGLLESLPAENGRDWAGFLDALAAFLERILPIIIQLFGGLA